MTETFYHTLPNGRRIACRFTPGDPDKRGPVVVFLPGYMSDMGGSKACALFDQAHGEGRACLLLDYSGCGSSPGLFADGTLSRWQDEVTGLIAALDLDDIVLVGSSMGGWLMLLVALAIPDRIRALVGIAAAPDFTDWGTPDTEKAALAADRTVFRDNPYGPEPTPTHAGFWADGQARRLLDATIAFDGPVRLIHGQRDNDVPWEIALRLAEVLRSDDVQVVLIKDGDHRLSRDQDIALLLRTVAQLTGEG